MNDSTNVRIIADNIRKLFSKTSTLEDAAARIPKDYSSDETNTGLKWTDGKEIYRKVIAGTFPTLAQPADVVLGSISGIDTLVNTWLVVKRTNDEILDLSNYAVRVNSGVFSIANVSSPYSESTFNMVVFYTKETATLTKKKTTKKG